MDELIALIEFPNPDFSSRKVSVEERSSQALLPVDCPSIAVRVGVEPLCAFEPNTNSPDLLLTFRSGKKEVPYLHDCRSD